MANVLGYDCDGNEIYEYMILRAIWSNDIDIEELDGADPRQYCAVIAEDGNAYAISVYDWWYKDLIRKHECLNVDDDISLIVKPISDMMDYECAISSDGNYFYYELDINDLRNQLNSILNSKTSNAKGLIRSRNK